MQCLKIQTSLGQELAASVVEIAEAVCIPEKWHGLVMSEFQIDNSCTVLGFTSLLCRVISLKTKFAAFVVIIPKSVLKWFWDLIHALKLPHGAYFKIAHTQTTSMY